MAPSKNWRTPGAIVIGDVRIGRDVNIWFNAVLRGDNEPIILRRVDRCLVGANSLVREGMIVPNGSLVVGVPAVVVRVLDEKSAAKLALGAVRYRDKASAYPAISARWRWIDDRID